MLDPDHLRSAAGRFRRFMASPMSTTLAYTAICLIGLLYAVCLEKMPGVVRERLARVVEWFS